MAVWRRFRGDLISTIFTGPAAAPRMTTRFFEPDDNTEAAELDFMAGMLEVLPRNLPSRERTSMAIFCCGIKALRANAKRQARSKDCSPGKGDEK